MSALGFIGKKSVKLARIHFVHAVAHHRYWGPFGIRGDVGLTRHQPGLIRERSIPPTLAFFFVVLRSLHVFRIRLTRVGVRAPLAFLLWILPLGTMGTGLNSATLRDWLSSGGESWTSHPRRTLELEPVVRHPHPHALARLTVTTPQLTHPYHDSLTSDSLTSDEPIILSDKDRDRDRDRRVDRNRY